MSTKENIVKYPQETICSKNFSYLQQIYIFSILLYCRISSLQITLKVLKFIQNSVKSVKTKKGKI